MPRTQIQIHQVEHIQPTKPNHIIMADNDGNPIEVHINDVIKQENVKPIKQTLDMVKKSAICTLIQAVQTAHDKYATSGSGMSMVYYEKVSEATDFAAGGYKEMSLHDYPLLSVEVEITGKRARDVAEAILNKRAQWIAKAAEIERVRLDCKKQILSSSSKRKIDNIVESAVEKLKAI